jgi:hypothetical protein
MPRDIYGAPDAVVAGGLRPSGCARPVDGGFIVDGRWSLASGIRHSAWWNAGCLVVRADGGAADGPWPPAPEPHDRDLARGSDHNLRPGATPSGPKARDIVGTKSAAKGWHSLTGYATTY